VFTHFIYPTISYKYNFCKKANTFYEVNNVKKQINGSDIPLGLGMALAKNINAMNYFSSLTNDKKQEIIDHTHQIQSKAEMREYVDSLSNETNFY